MTAVDNFMCGETEPLQKLPVHQVGPALVAACSAGHLDVLDYLTKTREMHVKECLRSDFYPLWTAANRCVGQIFVT